MVQNFAIVVSKGRKIGAGFLTNEISGNKNIKIMFHKRQEESETHLS